MSYDYGLLVTYWPGTTTVMNTSGEVPLDYPIGPDQAIIPYQDGIPYPLPAEDPRFYPEIEIPAKRVEMRKACDEEITRSSFQSSALGAIYNYDCRLVDQVNLQARYTLAIANVASEPVYASDGTRFEWLPHTGAQLLQVMNDMNQHIKQAQVKLSNRLSAVDLAVTREDLDAIVW